MSDGAPSSGDRQRLARFGPILLVLVLSLVMLTYVGFGEARRGYSRILFHRFAAQGEVVKGSVESLLRAGLPLRQYAGFSGLARSLLDADPLLEQLRITDEQGRVLFSESRSGEVAGAERGAFQPSGFAHVTDPFRVLEDERSFRLSLPLRDQFETVGHLEMTASKRVIAQHLEARFSWVFASLAGLVLVLAVVLFVSEPRWRHRARLWLNASSGLAFLVMALILSAALIDIYAEGLEEETDSQARSLSQRLDEVGRLGLSLSDIRGLDEIFRSYRRINPDISTLSLLAGDTVLVHTDPEKVGQLVQPDASLFTHSVPLAFGGATPESPVHLEVGIPQSAAFARLWHSSRNFLVLFIATGFLAALFLRSLGSFRGPVASAPGSAGDVDLVERIRPLYFLGCFIEGLNLTFLPQYFNEVAARSGSTVGVTSLLISTFFAFYVLVLLPAETAVHSVGIKRLLLWSLLASAVPLVMMGLTQGLLLLFLLRALAGAGQGALVTATQAYILAVSDQQRKTRGISIITSAYNGGMFAGTVIGALLAAYMGPRGVFLVSGALGLLALWYTVALIPELGPGTAPRVAASAHKQPSLFAGLARAVKDPEFLKATFLVGVPTKAIRSGVAVFALPLLLAHKRYDQDEIGHILMFYALGVLVSNHLIASRPDQAGRTRKLLLWGMVGSGLGLCFIGMMDLEVGAALGLPLGAALLSIVGLVVLGLSHGLIHSPIVTHVATSPAANTGGSTVVALYRLIDRLGQCIGPGLVSYLLVLNGESSLTFAWLGVAALCFGALFALQLHRNEGVRHA